MFTMIYLISYNETVVMKLYIICIICTFRAGEFGHVALTGHENEMAPKKR